MSDSKHKFYTIEVMCALATAILIFLSIIQVSLAIPPKFELYPNNAKVDGLSYSEWTAKWWEWLTNIPKEQNPGLDTSGEHCSVGQTGTVWFLAGTMGGSAERQCQIKQGDSILFSIIGGYCSYTTDATTKTESDLRNCARTGNDDAELQVSVDGIYLKNLEQSRITTEPFPITYMKDNVYGIAVGNTTAVADGYYVFLKPLAPGAHEIHFKGSIIENPAIGVVGNAVDVKYNIIVK